MLHLSTALQVDGYSLDAQRETMRKYADFQNMEIVREYSDKGHSSKNIRGRQEFVRMLNDIEDGKDEVSFVLVFKLSRFGRNAADVLSSLQLMQEVIENVILFSILNYFLRFSNEFRRIKGDDELDAIKMSI